MKINPIKDYVLVKLTVPEKTTVGGVELSIAKRPGSKEWEAQTLTGLVMAVGPDVSHVEVGEECLFRGDAGRWIDRELTEDEGKTHRIMDEAEILAVLERDLSTLPQPVEVL